MLVTEPQQLDQLIAEIRRLTPDEAIAIDTETTGLNIYQNDHITGMSVSYPAEIVPEGVEPALQSWYVPVAQPDSTNFRVQELVEALAATPALHVFHNAPFDWAVLAKETGIELHQHAFWNTQLIDWLMDENWDHRLKEGLGTRLFGIDAGQQKRELKGLMKGEKAADIYRELRASDDPRWTGKGTVPAAREESKRLAALTTKTWETLTAEDVYAYAEQDTELTFRARLWQVGQLPTWPLDVRPDIDREHDFQRVLYEMMRTGVKINPLAAINYRQAALDRIAEIEPMFEGINLSSPPQLAKMIYEDWGVEVVNRTKKGAPSTDKAALEEIEGAHPNVGLLLEFRKLTKSVGTYYDAFVEKRDANDRLHTSFSSDRTVTGRLSSSAPNLQNIPKESTNADVRSVFVPEPGLELWEYDLSQAELRVMAGWAKDETMISALLEGRDLHAETAYGIWGEESAGEKAEVYRTLAKNVGYGYPYGIGPKKVALYIVKGSGRAVAAGDIAQGAAILQGYARTYPGLARLMKGMQRAAERDGYVPLHVPGRYRRYKGAGYRIWETYTALNSIVQGAIGEYMKDWMLDIWPQQGGHGQFRVCLQVHDSLVCEVVPGSGDAVRELLQESLNRLNPFPVPMLLDAKKRS